MPRFIKPILTFFREVAYTQPIRYNFTQIFPNFKKHIVDFKILKIIKSEDS